MFNGMKIIKIFWLYFGCNEYRKFDSPVIALLKIAALLSGVRWREIIK